RAIPLLPPLSSPTRRSSDLLGHALLALAAGHALGLGHEVEVRRHPEIRVERDALRQVADAPAHRLPAGERPALHGSPGGGVPRLDRKSTRLNSSHRTISYAV